MGSPNDATWFEDHYYGVPREIVAFFAGDGIDLEGRSVADLGTGDGIIALGLHNLARPSEVVGFDIQPVDRESLASVAKLHGLGDGLPDTLRFEQSTSRRITADDGTFDIVTSWSVFEHVSDPTAMAAEIRRVLVPDGFAMIQLFPFYLSERGDHGWERPSFSHLLSGRDDPPPGVHLNRITLDGLHTALRAGGMRTTKVELIHHAFHLPRELVDRALTDLAIGGVKLMAVPDIQSGAAPGVDSSP
jgi:SAM-dependent methyltransferase